MQFKRAYADDRTVGEVSEEKGETKINIFLCLNTSETKATTTRAKYFKLTTMYVQGDSIIISTHTQHMVQYFGVSVHVSNEVITLHYNENRWAGNSMQPLPRHGRPPPAAAIVGTFQPSIANDT